MIPVALGLLLASLVHLGPETPVGTRASGAAASQQYAPSIAWNGHSGLVVWTDQRSSYPADVASPRIVPPQLLRVSPMRADGSLVNPEGTPLFPAYFGRVASNGSSFMLAYVDDAGINTVPLNENGEVDGVQTRLSDSGFQFDIVSNQHTFLFVSTMTTGVQAVVLQPSGIPTAVKTFSGAYPQFAPAVTAFGDVYALAYSMAPCETGCVPAIHLALMAEDAATTDVTIADGAGPLGLTASDDRLMLARIGNDGIQTLTAGRDLKVIAPFKTVAPMPNEYAFPPMLWDGQSFLVTLFRNESLEMQWEGIRVSPDNVPLDSQPAVIARDRPFDVAIARTSDGIVATWSAMDDVYRRTFLSGADLFVEPVTKTPVVFSAHAQSQASASSGVRVWREGSLDTRIMLSAGDRTVEVAIGLNGGLRNPSVAVAGNVILVLWRDVPPYRGQLADVGYRVYARRFTRDGTPLDPQPLLVERNDSDYVDLDLSTAAAFDGRNFVAIWSAGTYSNSVLVPSVRAIRIAPDGTFVDSTPLFIAGISDLGFTTSLRAISTGSELLVAWSTWNDYRYIHGISPLPSPRTAIAIVRLDTRSSSMNVLDRREIWNDGDLAKQIDLAWNGTNALLASVHHGCVTLTLLDAALATKSENASAECATANPGKSIEHPAVAWNGSEFVAAWAADAVHAMRFDRTLQPLDTAPFNVAPTEEMSHEPSLAASPSGVEITYERLDGEVPRLFSRELDRLGVVPRTRSIR